MYFPEVIIPQTQKSGQEVVKHYTTTKTFGVSVLFLFVLVFFLKPFVPNIR